jgi:hypothetical protein
MEFPSLYAINVSQDSSIVDLARGDSAVSIAVACRAIGTLAG